MILTIWTVIGKFTLAVTVNAYTIISAINHITLIYFTKVAGKSNVTKTRD